ncbi:unnamed protein product [Echinostoma caproni]|uniref:Transmembrane protein n=1 Tax=Echinostoma caproni TaxID=27848 RepID=A0A183AIT9_9TREM|nr:unnamed protein product [Echinostoma caproni]
MYAMSRNKQSVSRKPATFGQMSFKSCRRIYEKLTYRISEHILSSKRSSTSTSALQQVYLENSIFFLSLLSLALGIMLQWDSDFLELRVFSLKEHCSIKENQTSCVYKQQDYRHRPLEVKSGMSEIEKIVDYGWTRAENAERSDLLELMCKFPKRCISWTTEKC